MKGVSVKRISELFHLSNNRVDNNQEIAGQKRTINEQPQELKEVERELIDSFRKRNESIGSDSSQDQERRRSTEYSKKRLNHQEVSNRFASVKLKRRIESRGENTRFISSRYERDSTHWKTVEEMDLGPEENNQIETLVKSSMSFQKKNAFNLTNKHKMFFKLVKKNEMCPLKLSQPTQAEEVGKISSKLSSGISVSSSLKNYITSNLEKPVRKGITITREASMKIPLSFALSPSLNSSRHKIDNYMNSSREIPEEVKPKQGLSHGIKLNSRFGMNFSKPIKQSKQEQVKNEKIIEYPRILI